MIGSQRGPCGKRNYATRAGAETAVANFEQLTAAYWCKRCRAYHVTSQRQRRR